MNKNKLILIILVGIATLAILQNSVDSTTLSGCSSGDASTPTATATPTATPTPTATTPPACNTAADQCTGNDSNDQNFGSSNRYWISSEFIADANATLCELTIRLKEIGTIASPLNACIYSTTGSSPDAEIDCSPDDITTDDLSTSCAGVTFTGLSAPVTAGTHYWIVIKASMNDNSNHPVACSEDNDCLADNETIKYSTDTVPSAWVFLSGNHAIEFTSKKE